MKSSLYEIHDGAFSFGLANNRFWVYMPSELGETKGTTKELGMVRAGKKVFDTVTVKFNDLVLFRYTCVSLIVLSRKVFGAMTVICNEETEQACIAVLTGFGCCGLLRVYAYDMADTQFRKLICISGPALSRWRMDSTKVSASCPCLYSLVLFLFSIS